MSCSSEPVSSFPNTASNSVTEQSPPITSHVRRKTMNRPEMEKKPPIDDQARELELAQIRDALRGLRYGAVSIVVQDGVVVQIDRTEKRRLSRGRDTTGS